MKTTFLTKEDLNKEIKIISDSPYFRLNIIRSGDEIESIEVPFHDRRTYFVIGGYNDYLG